MFWQNFLYGNAVKKCPHFYNQIEHPQLYAMQGIPCTQGKSSQNKLALSYSLVFWLPWCSAQF